MVISLGAPWWLIALAAIPLIRWLHRWQAPLSTAPVSAVFLWESATSLNTGGEMRQTPEPAWRRRALIAALLVLALAEPVWQRESGRITVWIDDSLSMSASEQGASRLDAGLAELQRALQEVDAGVVLLRSLSDPARAMRDNEPGAFNAGKWLAVSQGEPDPPPVALLSRDEAQWLVTDGANQHLIAWANNAPLERIIRVGDATENVAVTRLAARRSPESADNIDLLIGVSNLGQEETRRELRLAAGAGILDAQMLTLHPGETRHLWATHVLGEDKLIASLSPGDAVVRDDSLALQLSAISRIPVLLDVACPAQLSLAIRAHPVMDIVAAGSPAELQVLCSAQTPSAKAVLRFHLSAPAPIDAQAEWWPGVGRLKELYLPRDWLAAAAWDGEIGEEYETLLEANGVPLVIRDRNQQSVIETVLDMSRPQFASQPEYVALIAGLIDLSLGRSSLDAIATSMTDPDASRIAPSDAAPSLPARIRDGEIGRPLANALLLLAILVLIADMLLLWRASRAAHRA